jgi:hypothetical protein
MYIARCFGKKNTRRIMIIYAIKYSLLCIKYCLVKEIPCLSPEGQAIVKEYGDWYMTPIGVYIKIVGSTNPPHWLPHFVPDSLLLQEISYQTFVKGVAASLHKYKKGI